MFFCVFVVVQGGGAAAKKVKTEDDPSKINWQEALAQGQVRMGLMSSHVMLFHLMEYKLF